MGETTPQHHHRRSFPFIILPSGHCLLAVDPPHNFLDPLALLHPSLIIFSDVRYGGQQTLHGARGLHGPALQRQSRRVFFRYRFVGNLYTRQAVRGHERRGSLPIRDSWRTEATAQPQLAGKSLHHPPGMLERRPGSPTVYLGGSRCVTRSVPGRKWNYCRAIEAAPGARPTLSRRCSAKGESSRQTREGRTWRTAIKCR